MNLLAILLPSILPIVGDGFRSLISKITGIGGAEPRTVDESIRLMESQTKRIQAMSTLDNPGGEVSRWVANYRGLHRYALGDAIFLATIIYIFFIPAPKTEIADFLLNLSASVFSFFFGDKVYFHLKNK